MTPSELNSWKCWFLCGTSVFKH